MPDVNSSPEQILILKNFDAKLEVVKREATIGILYEVENKFGYSATHIGKAPSEWVKLGGCNLVVATI
jgi:hypothetical protein